MNKNTIPFTYHWIIREAFKDCKTILDIGCGHGHFMKELNDDKKFSATGVDIFPDYIEQAKNTGAYTDVILQDIRTLNFPKDSFDGVLLSQVIEHVTKEEADALITVIEQIAKKVIVIATPNGEFEQTEYHGNIYQEHHSSWHKEDFIQRNYRVYGQGAKFIYDQNGPYHKRFAKNNSMKQALFGISYACAPLMYIFPEQAAQLIAVKKYE